jgi:hypothetical protein
MVAMLIMGFGGLLYAYVIGSVCNIVSNMDMATKMYEQVIGPLVYRHVPVVASIQYKVHGTAARVAPICAGLEPDCCLVLRW